MSQLYCVVAEARADKSRSAVTGPMSEERANAEKSSMNAQKRWRDLFRYFRVAKYPYKMKRNA